MSEYQYIEFRAVDRALTDEELDFARDQSTRAEITRRQFTSEYNYGSFRGDVDGLLRRGFDVYLEFTNYGDRTIKMRLPFGLPFPKNVCKRYVDGRYLKWKKDRKGAGGILTLEPYFETREPYWEFADCLDVIVEARKRLMLGDLRVLYLLWLCVAGDENYLWEEATEPPVPLGLEEFPIVADELFHFFDLDPLFVTAAATGQSAADRSLPPGKQTKKNLGEHQLPELPSGTNRIDQWLKSVSSAEAKKMLERLLTEDEASVKAEILAALPATNTSATDWPTCDLKRSFQELMDTTNVLREKQAAEDQKKEIAKAKRAAKKAQKQREERMAKMVLDPQKWIRETDDLVDARGLDNYEQAAEILADLHEALGHTKHRTLAKKHAAHLAAAHPTLKRLKSFLRKQQLLD